MRLGRESDGMSRYADIEPIIKKIKYTMEIGEIRGRIWFEMVLKDLEELPEVDAVPVVQCKNCIYRGKPTECPFARYEQKQNPNYTTQTTTSPNADYVAQTIITAVDYTSDDDYCSRGVAWRKKE